MKQNYGNETNFLKIPLTASNVDQIPACDLHINKNDLYLHTHVSQFSLFPSPYAAL